MRVLLVLAAWAALAQGAAGDPGGPAGRPQLPPPTGKYAVGRTVYSWTDSSRSDSSGYRQLLVFAWYPATASRGGPTTPYIPAFSVIEEHIGVPAMKDELGAAYDAVKKGQVSTHTRAGAPTASKTAHYPVLVFSHGFGETGLTYTAQLEDLASHGYIVFAVEHPHDAYAVAYPDGHVTPFAQAPWDSAKAAPNGAVRYQLAQIPARARDLLFVIDRVAREASQATSGSVLARIDLGRLGVFGHSLGGMAAAEACHRNSRIRACMNQDSDYQGVPWLADSVGSPVSQPFAFLATRHSLYVTPYTTPPTPQELAREGLTSAGYDSLLRVLQRNQNDALRSVLGGAYRVALEPADFTHRSFLDLRLLSATDPAAQRRHASHLALARRYTRAFFDKVLRDARSGPLDKRPAASDSVTIDRWPPH